MLPVKNYSLYSLQTTSSGIIGLNPNAGFVYHVFFMSLVDGDRFSSPGDINNLFRENVAIKTLQKFFPNFHNFVDGDENLSPSTRDKIDRIGNSKLNIPQGTIKMKFPYVTIISV